MRRLARWLLPGLGIKRWLLLSFVGLVVIAVGFNMVFDRYLLSQVERVLINSLFYITGEFIPPRPAGVFIILLGGVALAVSIQRVALAVIAVLVPRGQVRLSDLFLQRKELARGPRLVTIGGGTGLSTLLRGLKEHTSNITAVVTVTDNGGSSGRLRDALGIPAVGDIRNCLVALADTERLMEELFQYRFGGQSELAGHSFGNLFLAALTDVTGNLELAVRESSKILSIRGRVLPSTLDDAVLEAEFDDGSQVRGELEIVSRTGRIREIRMVPPDCRPLPETMAAIAEADAIILGPGSLYTSVIPNLLVPGVAEAISRSKALVIYVVNVMTQPGETVGYGAMDHVQAVAEYLRPAAIDYVVVNTSPINRRLLERYRAEGASVVRPQVGEIEQLGIKVFRGPVASAGDYVRHDPGRLARAVIEILERTKTGGERTRLLNTLLGGHARTGGKEAR
ncbi:MAG: YvcK family protein [Bacillota bacterium]